MKRRWLRILVWVLLAKALYLGLLTLVLWLWPDMDMRAFHGMMMRWPRSGPAVFASHFGTWDAAHYIYLSEVGYTKGVPSIAFYPLWPLLIRWVAWLSGGSTVLIGMLLANGFSAVGWVLFHRIVARRWSESVANGALLWLVIFPGSLFYQFIYSEPLFFLLIMGVWYGLESGRYDVAWISACLAPLTRALGLFCLLPIGWRVLMQWPVGPLRRWVWVKRERERWKSGEVSDTEGMGRSIVSGNAESGTARRDGSQNTRDACAPPPVGSQNTRDACAPQRDAGNSRESAVVHAETRALPMVPYWLLLAPLLGWGVYLGLMWVWTGNPFSGFAAQKYWGVHSIGNLFNVPKFIIGWLRPTAWHAFTGSLLDRLMFLLLLYTLPVIWRLGKDLVVWTYILGILPAMSGTFTSNTRFAAVVFPMFVALAVVFERRHWSWLKWILLAAFVLLHLVLLWRFVNFRWAG